MLRLTLAVSNYDRIMALALGDVQAEGIDLDVHRLATPQVLARGSAFEFDIAEYSISRYVEERASGNDRFQALPVFLSRFFRHWSTYVRADGGITSPADLRGKRVGVLNYRYTSSVWVRGILQHEFGILPAEMSWIQLEDFPPPADPAVQLMTQPGGDLGAMLLSGEVDAIVAPYAPAAMLGPVPKVRRLLPDAGIRERDQFRKTGIFPQMHTLVIKRSVLEAHPFVAGSLVAAFDQSKNWAMTQLKALRLSLPWLYEQVEELEVLMGPDFWPYGLEANRAGLETLTGYMVEQHLIREAPALETLFLD